MITNYDWIRIDDLTAFLPKNGIRQIDPADPEHTRYWRRQKKICIEGLWAEQVGGFRYMPGRLYFYGNFATIIDTDPKEKTRRNITPRIDDIEWERAYMYLEAEGFSGWSESETTTSNHRIKTIRKNYDSSASADPDLFKPNGNFRDFVEPRTAIRMLHDRPMGVPLYGNPTRNICELGSRGGGKSYWYALAGALYRICFDGIKYYTEENRTDPPTVNVLVGSGRADKSSEFCTKIEDAMNALATDQSKGAWGNIGHDDYQPSPFYKDMKGSLKTNNKGNPWRHEYKVNIGGRWVDGYGTLSKIYHVNYSTQKRDGAEAGAGGRYSDVIYEESGLTELLIDAYNSNEATTGTGATKFGVQIFLGTSGNMDTVGPIRKIFTHPDDYDVLKFRDVYEAGSDTGFFLPAEVTAREFKDDNGNTNFEEAVAYYNSREELAASSDDSSVLRAFRMNYPRKPTDMWQTEQGSILPSREAEEREKELTRNNLYEHIGKCVKLHWVKGSTSQVDYEIDHTARPFYDWPIRPTRDSFDGAIVIFDPPISHRGGVPDDAYVFTHDPYVTDEMYRGGSLGATHVWLSPKYWSGYMNASPLVATYIGRPLGGKRIYYRNLEKLLAYYGNPTRGLWYEADRGEYCREYFIRRKKSGLLSLRPLYVEGDEAQLARVTRFGFKVGSKLEKITKLDDLSEMLLRPLETGTDNTLFIHTLPCIFTVRQIRMYNMEDNFDAISSILAFPMYERETEHIERSKLRNKHRKNPLSFLSTNQRVLNGYYERKH